MSASFINQSFFKIIQSRSRAGILQRNDSLEFTADLYKLLGDWHYENSNIDMASYQKAGHYYLQASHIYTTYADIFGDKCILFQWFCQACPSLADLLYQGSPS